MARVDAEEREALRAQLSDYLSEFAEMEGVEVERSDDGAPVYRWFEAYWRDEHRLPFFIEAASTVVGFCLIRVIDDGWNVAEFGISPERRREGLGRAAVGAVATAAEKAGASHLRADVHEWNECALSFWTSCGFVPVIATGGILSTRLTLNARA